MKRIVFRIQWDRPRKKWAIYWGKQYQCDLFPQSSAVAFAVEWANEQLWRRYGKPTQVVLHGKDGRIRWERTYGRDPRRSKG